MGQVADLSRPELLSDRHDLERFDSGEASLDEWLRRRARSNQVNCATRTYVVCAGRAHVIAYYALASGVITVAEAAGRFRRNMPDPIPVVVVARLAIDREWQRMGLGRALFRDAAMRVAQAAEIIGIRGIIVGAISEDAKTFYISLGFTPSRSEPMLLMATLADILDAMG
jgi:GNAT superfamily N-acetyltransferase